MSRTSTVCGVVLACALVALLVGGALADAQPPASDTASGPPIVVAQARPASAPSTESAKPADVGALSERVNALENEDLVLREDLGRARLDARSELEAAAQRQAEAIARLNNELAETRARLEAERAAQARRNRNLWTAVGVLAIGVMLSN